MKNLNIDRLLQTNQLDTLIDIMRIIRIDLNFQRITIVIFCEFVYNVAIIKQISIQM